MARRTGRDPVSGRPMLDGITAITSERTGTVTYQARWSWTGPAGERRHGAKIFKDLFGAETHLLETQLAVRRGTFQEPERITVAQYAERWLDRKARTWAPSTELVRRDAWNRLIAPMVGDRRVSALTREHCQLVADGLAARGLSPQSVRSSIHVLSGLLEAAVADDLVPRNVARGLILPPVEREDHALWTAAQVRRFLASTPDHPLHPMWVLQVACGLRIGEAIALTWPDIELDDGHVTIRRTVQRQTDGSQGIGERTKTRQQRTIPLPPAVVDVLRAHHQRQAQRPSAVINLRAFVFPGRDGAPMRYEPVLRALRRAIADAGLPAVPRSVRNPLRHMTATLLAERGAGPAVAQRILGHSSPVMTLDRYTHVSARQTSKALNDLAELVLRDTTTSPKKSGSGTGSV